MHYHEIFNGELNRFNLIYCRCYTVKKSLTNSKWSEYKLLFENEIIPFKLCEKIVSCKDKR